MNAWQIAKQLKYLFRQQTWPDPGGALVWAGRVHVTNGMAEEEYSTLGHPAVLIGIGDDEADAQTPGYVRQIFSLFYYCAVAGDLRGENALIGANRLSGNTGSSGRGIMEFAIVVTSLIRQIQETFGVKIIGTRKTDQGTGIVPGLGYVAARKTTFTVKCTDAPYYHPPLRLQLTTPSSGHATLTWTDPPTRFDQFATPFSPTGPSATLPILVMRKSGPTVPQSTSDGTLVATVNRGVQTFVDAPGVGTWSYSLFASYTDSGLNQQERYNDGPAVEAGISGSITV